MASVLTHKKVPEWGGFNWDSPRQRHRFCYKVDGGASFFSDLGNQNISGFRHTKQIEIKNPQNKQIQNNKKTKIPQISHTQIAYMRSDGFFFFQCCSGNNDPTDLCHTICAIKIRSFVVFIPISEWKKKISRSLLHSLCPHDPWDSLIFSLQIQFFLFFSAYLFQMGSEGKIIFRSFGVQICTTRSDGFLTP